MISSLWLYYILEGDVESLNVWVYAYVQVCLGMYKQGLTGEDRRDWEVGLR